MTTSGTRGRQRDQHRPRPAALQQPRDRQQQQHRVVVPQDRRQQLARDDRHEVRRHRRQPQRRATNATSTNAIDTYWMSCAVSARHARLVRHGARREVVGRGDRVGHPADQRQEVGPGLARRRAAWRSPPGAPARSARTATARFRPVRNAHSSTSPGWILIAAPSAPLDAQHRRLRDPRASPPRTAGTAAAPPGPASPRTGTATRGPASSTISHCVRPETGISAVPIANAATEQPDPEPGRRPGRQQPERQDRSG